MNEIFQDDIINTAVGILWAAGGLSPSMWSAEMNLFVLDIHNVQSSNAFKF
jgi:hypothetical protein